jgi:hypothetical protein
MSTCDIAVHSHDWRPLKWRDCRPLAREIAVHSQLPLTPSLPSCPSPFCTPLCRPATCDCRPVTRDWHSVICYCLPVTPFADQKLRRSVTPFAVLSLRSPPCTGRMQFQSGELPRPTLNCRSRPCIPELTRYACDGRRVYMQAQTLSLTREAHSTSSVSHPRSPTHAPRHHHPPSVATSATRCPVRPRPRPHWQTHGPSIPPPLGSL